MYLTKFSFFTTTGNRFPGAGGISGWAYGVTISCMINFYYN